jgi:hypothetical protein
VTLKANRGSDERRPSRALGKKRNERLPATAVRRRTAFPCGSGGSESRGRRRRLGRWGFPVSPLVDKGAARIYSISSSQLAIRIKILFFA